MEPNSLIGNQEETVYGDETVGSEVSESGSDVPVVSDRIQSLANSIYQEFESSINQYGEDSVKSLMPLVVSILESLNQQCTEKQDIEVELDLIKDDNLQLISQYEREKQLRKLSEERILKLEDNYDEKTKELGSKVESLESIVRMLELKSRNAQDHSTRLEDKEVEMKKEYNKLHERYTELFRSHMEYIERTKMMIGNDRPHGNPSDAPTTFSASGPHHAAQSRIRSSFPIAGQTGYANTEAVSANAKDMRAPDADRGPNLQHELHMACEVMDARADGSSKFGDTDESFQELTMAECPAEASGDEGGPDSADEQDVDSEFGSILRRRRIKRLSTSRMSREIENLIKENQELIETKNALNVVKDDLITQVDDLTGENLMLREDINTMDSAKSRLKVRISELELETKDLKSQCEELKRKLETGDEDDDAVPMSQRRRFTRVEMARVLMERNNYKERLMELQEAVRWTEMIRASREHPDILPAKRRSLLDRFSNLFGNKSKQPPQAHGSVRFGQSTGTVRPYDLSRRLVDSVGMPEDKSRAYDFLQEDHRSQSPARAPARPKSNLAWIKKDANRKHAYGWSIPSKAQSTSGTVPIPIYCRPLSAERQPGVKLWCACGVNMTGARTRDGSSVVGSSIFYGERRASNASNNSEVERLSQELKAHCDAVQASLRVPEGATSLLWICSSGHNHSQLTIIDANHPSDVLDSFYVTKSQVLCLGAVPGAAEEDYGPQGGEERPVNAETASPAPPAAAGNGAGAEGGGEAADVLSINVSHVKCSVEEAEAAGDDSDNGLFKTAQPPSLPGPTEAGEDPEEPPAGDPLGAAPEEAIKTSRPTGNNSSTQSSPPAGSAQVPPPALTSLQPTMWLGCQSGHIFVHSTVANWRKCLHTVKLNDSILCIVHIQGRVFIGLADGTIVVFSRDTESGEWNLSSYQLLDLGRPHHSVRCLSAVADRNLWIGYRNQILILDATRASPLNRLRHRIDAHPRPDYQVRQMCWTGDGVWVSIRPDATLRLFHAYTYEHLQDMDVEPHVTKMIDSSKLGFSLVRVTSLMVSSGRLWIGTANGVILTVPFNTTADDVRPRVMSDKEPPARVYEEGPAGEASTREGASTHQQEPERAIAPATFLPLVNADEVHMSFHGHRDVVKFFVAVPGKPQKQSTYSTTSPQRSMNNILVMSGGEGYVDFRNVPDSEQSGGSVDKVNLARNERSYLIVWQVFTGNP